MARRRASKRTYIRSHSLDKDQWFFHPVSAEDVPDYYDVIQHPMTWTQIRANIDAMAYSTVADWEADVRLVCANAQQYNARDSAIYRAAGKLLQHLDSIVADVNHALQEAPGCEPPTPVWHSLRAPYEAPSGMPIGAPPADTSCLDAFLHQWYTVSPPTPPTPPSAPSAPSAPKPRRTRPERVRPAPTRRSARHVPAEVETSQPREVAALSDHDSFKYFHVGWMLPPGTRRGNRPRPPPVAPKPRRRRRTAVVEDDSSLSELSEGPS